MVHVHFGLGGWDSRAPDLMARGRRQGGNHQYCIPPFLQLKRDISSRIFNQQDIDLSTAEVSQIACKLAQRIAGLGS